MDPPKPNSVNTVCSLVPGCLKRARASAKRPSPQPLHPSTGVTNSLPSAFPLCTPTKFLAGPAQLLTPGLNDEVDGCAPGEELLNHLQVPGEERVLHQQILALQGLPAPDPGLLGSHIALGVEGVGPSTPLLIQLLLVLLQRALHGRAEGKGAVHDGQHRGQLQTLQTCCSQEFPSQAASCAGCSQFAASQLWAGFGHRLNSPLYK